VQRQLLENATIVTVNDSKEIIENGYLLLEGSTIAGVGEGDVPVDPKTTKVTDLRGSVIMPGLVNAHNHSYANLVKGTTENLPLELWMLYTLAEGRKLTIEDVYISSLLGSIEMLKGGTTAFLDHQPQPLEALLGSAKAYEQARIRALVTPQFGNRPYNETLPQAIEISSLPPEHQVSNDVEPYLEMLTSLLDSLSAYGDRIRCGVGPSGPQRCSDPLLLASYEFAEEHDLPWHIHVLETKAQEATAQKLYGKRMVEHLNELGILSSRCSLAHVVWISEEEIQTLADKDVSVVHNPASNLFLGSGMMPLIELREAGVRVAVGTDGPNCSGFQSMFESMKLAAILSNVRTPDFSRWVRAIEVLEMSTKNSAYALGMADRLGSLEVGKEADFVIVDPKASALVPLNNLVWQLVYGRTDLFISDVYIGGEKVVENGQLLTVDENGVYEEALARGKWLLDRLQVDYERIKTDHPKLKEMIMRLWQ
jgi:5-methylthioadenosine/S-adenosylhomocysteine deaminase